MNTALFEKYDEQSEALTALQVTRYCTVSLAQIDDKYMYTVKGMTEGIRCLIIDSRPLNHHFVSLIIFNLCAFQVMHFEVEGLHELSMIQFFS